VKELQLEQLLGRPPHFRRTEDLLQHQFDFLRLDPHFRLLLVQFRQVVTRRPLSPQPLTFTIFDHFSFSLSPSKGFFPTSISNAKIPTAQISRFGPESSPPRAYSGDRYSTVPTISALVSRGYL
jgi:hypothetical protein